MIFRFQYVAEDGPQDLGEGEWSGGNAVDDAISDLAEKRGESLPAGEYRYRPLGLRHRGSGRLGGPPFGALVLLCRFWRASQLAGER